MPFSRWIDRRHMTTIYDMCPSKLDGDATLALWYIAKATKLLKNKTRKHKKNVATLAATGHINF